MRLTGDHWLALGFTVAGVVVAILDGSVFWAGISILGGGNWFLRAGKRR